jgi:hypothetical protein
MRAREVRVHCSKRKAGEAACLVFLVLGAAACPPPAEPPKTGDAGPSEGEGEGEPEFADEALTGFVGGESWTFQAGTAFSDSCDSIEPLVCPEGLSVSLISYDPVVGVCEGPAIDPPRIRLTIPAELGTFRLDRDVRFSDAFGGEVVAARVDVRIDYIDLELPDVVQGAIAVRFDDENDVNGTFWAEVCAPD